MENSEILGIIRNRYDAQIEEKFWVLTFSS